ncbi:MAG: MarR family winged helix-turn-helix transcriptional regulator [Alcaligenes sp.]
MSTSEEHDAVDLIIKQWRGQRPDLPNLDAMALLGRMTRCFQLVQKQMSENFRRHGLQLGEFDVLASLRRSGPPYTLAPTALFSTLMVSSGTMTHRLQGLEKQGLIERIADPEDARRILVRLSPAGLACVDTVVVDHLANEENLLEGLNTEQRQSLDSLLRDWMRVLESRQT